MSGVALFVCAVWMSAISPPVHAESRPGALVGKPAPSFEVQGPYNEAYSLESFKGHILVMQFGTSW